MVSENPKKRKQRRVGIQRIEDRGKLNTTFTKRRQGLFKKSMDICQKYDGAQAAVITFSRSGNAYACGDPQVETVLKRYLADPSSSVAQEGAARNNGEGTVDGGGIAERSMVVAPTDSDIRIIQALGKGQPAWDMALENLGLAELHDMETAVKDVKSKIAARKNQIKLDMKSKIAALKNQINLND